ncbi:CS-domain-containing protein [Aspergillus sclerotioniger CBS 115572]|uniref:CS-domain-containing protein n=1 Tax=Aspergillus sclerotioniger CBS 115572 TaxID=1450535 RepID=A0A317WJW1_9EURO|nr:CS-domain-containing protein [Aspergillus sclerotioniger CBS 115572]PWY86355.1 CS-domain-containing protein [Aspergillus sclerotioniger CBS 115572]
MNAASLGDASLAATDYPTALTHYTTALLTHPRSPAYYIKRSTAFSRLKPTPNLTSALRDAEVAVVLARERGKRELIVSAQMRRGIVLFLMGRYADAGFLFGRVEEMIGLKGEGQAGEEDKEEKLRNAMGGGAGGNKAVEAEVKIWSAKVKGKISAGDVGEVEIKEVPEGVKVPGEGELKAQLEVLKGGKVDVGGEGEGKEEKKDGEKKAEEKVEAKEEASQQQAKAQPAVEKVRHEWYQSTDRVVVTLYVKGVPKDKVDVELKEDTASLQFPLPSGAEYDFTLDPLFAPINPSASKVSVMSTKIEILLCKHTVGQKWSALESTATDLKLSDRQAALNTTTTTTASAPAPAPAYPTSSRHGAKDWDKLASSLTAKKPKEKTKKTKTNGEGEGEDEADTDAESVNSDYGAADPVDGFFKKLYANADPDTRRAMMKSYVESQGTSLSTNWDEVSQGPVKVRPPSE